MTELDQLLAPYVEAACSRKATNVVALDVRELTSYTDVFIVMSANSTRQVKSIAEHIRKHLKKTVKPMSIDGTDEGQWVLMDFGDVILHIFHEPIRGFYDLEGLWADAPRVAEDRIAELEASAPAIEDEDADDFWEWDDDEEV